MKDSADRYGTVTRVLHWTVAALILLQFGGMILKGVVGRTPLMGLWVGSHGSIGMLLLALALLRLSWAIGQRRRRPPYQAGPIGGLAKLGHRALYALLLIVPALAVLRMIGGERPIKLFGATLRGPQAGQIEWMTAPANLLHGTLAWALLALIAGHVVMALVHQFVWKDGTIGLMLGRGKLAMAKSGRPR